MAFPASSQLPDEIIKEILAPALHVPDETFADTALRASPFATYGLSSSTISVVCKSWLRVATPLLYDTVVLRSKAQAQALAAALKRDSQLGAFIKKLRIEGGYGNAIFEILKRSLHITDIWISTALWSNESAAGYAKGFLLVNPCRLIVVDDRLKTSAIRNCVYEALVDAIKQKWHILVRDPPFLCRCTSLTRLRIQLYLSFQGRTSPGRQG
jgi:F-box-like